MPLRATHNEQLGNRGIQPNQDSNPRPVNRKSDALPIKHPYHLATSHSHKFLAKCRTTDKHILVAGYLIKIKLLCIKCWNLRPYGASTWDWGGRCSPVLPFKFVDSLFIRRRDDEDNWWRAHLTSMNCFNLKHHHHHTIQFTSFTVCRSYCSRLATV